MRIATAIALKAYTTLILSVGTGSKSKLLVTHACPILPSELARSSEGELKSIPWSPRQLVHSFVSSSQGMRPAYTPR